MNMRNWFTFPGSCWLLWSLVVFLNVYLLLSAAVAQEKREVVDRLHGFAFTPQEGWSAQVIGNAILFHDTYRFVLVRAVRYDGNLQKAAKAWMDERKASEEDFRASRYAFRKVGKGVVLYGEGLSYPYDLLPIQAVNFGLTGQIPPNHYREVTSILPGEKYALVVTYWFPEGTPKAKLDEMTTILRSLRFLPPQQMVKWRTERVMDPEAGMEAATLHVPEGFEFRGSVILQGTKRVTAMLVQKGDKMIRTDHIDIQSSVVQAGGMGNGFTLVTINGQSAQLPQAVFAQSEDEVIQLLLALWQEETGREWTLKEKRNLPMSEHEQRVWAQAQQAAQGLAMMGAQAVNNPIKVFITAESGSLRRTAIIQGSYGASGRADWVAANQQGHISMIVGLTQAPVSEFEQTAAVFHGCHHSYRANPAQAISALARWTADNKRLNDLVRQMTQGQREFNSRMATAWTNLLSDQTYVKDPQTGEISRVYKQSWETGGFWREPIFGDVLLGGVKEGSRLEELLRSEGWRRMQESLEGFPQK